MNNYKKIFYVPGNFPKAIEQIGKYIHSIKSTKAQEH